jgi:acyl-CoA thioester hydrolase
MAVHIFRTQVRYNEVDKMGGVHNSFYYVYMELARTDLVRVEGAPYKQMEEEGVLIPVVKSGCTFHQPARYDDFVDIETSAVDIKNASSRFEYLIRRADGTLLAKGFTTHAIVDARFEITPFPKGGAPFSPSIWRLDEMCPLENNLRA